MQGNLRMNNFPVYEGGGGISGQGALYYAPTNNVIQQLDLGNPASVTTISKYAKLNCPTGGNVQGHSLVFGNPEYRSYVPQAELNALHHPMDPNSACMMHSQSQPHLDAFGVSLDLQTAHQMRNVSMGFQFQASFEGRKDLPFSDQKDVSFGPSGQYNCNGNMRATSTMSDAAWSGVLFEPPDSSHSSVCASRCSLAEEAGRFIHLH